MIQPVTRIVPLTRLDKVHRSNPYKIESLPLDLPQIEQKEKTNRMYHLSPWLITVGFILVVGLLNGLIGG